MIIASCTNNCINGSLSSSEDRTITIECPIENPTSFSGEIRIISENLVMMNEREIVSGDTTIIHKSGDYYGSRPISLDFSSPSKSDYAVEYNYCFY